MWAHCDILIIIPGLNKSMKLGAVAVLKFREEAFDDECIIYLERKGLQIGDI